LDGNDSNLRLFLSDFVAAVQTIFPDAGRKTQAMFNASDLPPVSVLAGSLINELDLLGVVFGGLSPGTFRMIVLPSASGLGADLLAP
jgi:hypothetical protein